MKVSAKSLLPERWQWLLSGAIAILISLLALWIGFNLKTNSTITGRSLKIGSVVLMGTVFLPMARNHFSLLSFWLMHLHLSVVWKRHLNYL